MPYNEAVEEALCFGWIDSIVKSIDEHSYAQKFSRRKPQSKWALSNIERVRKMIAAGKMTAPGMEAFAGHESRMVSPQPTVLPETLEQKFKSSKAAWQNFCGFPPGYRRATIAWVASAKCAETQDKRLATLIETSARNERIKYM